MTSVANDYKLRPVTPPHDESLLQQKDKTILQNQNINLTGLSNHKDTGLTNSNGKPLFCYVD